MTEAELEEIKRLEANGTLSMEEARRLLTEVKRLRAALRRVRSEK